MKNNKKYGQIMHKVGMVWVVAILVIAGWTLSIGPLPEWLWRCLLTLAGMTVLATVPVILAYFFPRK